MGDDEGHGGAAVGCELRACIEAEPADPEHGRAEHHVARVVRRPCFLALAEEHREHEGRKACRLVDDDAARKVDRSVVGGEPAAPDPVGDRRVTKQHPQGGEGHEEAVADALHVGTDDERRRDDHEGHLEREEQSISGMVPG